MSPQNSPHVGQVDHLDHVQIYDLDYLQIYYLDLTGHLQIDDLDHLHIYGLYDMYDRNHQDHLDHLDPNMPLRDVAQDLYTVSEGPTQETCPTVDHEHYTTH